MSACAGSTSSEAAGHERRAELLTTNVRHFPMIAGLRPAY